MSELYRDTSLGTDTNKETPVTSKTDYLLSVFTKTKDQINNTIEVLNEVKQAEIEKEQIDNAVEKAKLKLEMSTKNVEAAQINAQIKKDELIAKSNSLIKSAIKSIENASDAFNTPNNYKNYNTPNMMTDEKMKVLYEPSYVKSIDSSLPKLEMPNQSMESLFSKLQGYETTTSAPFSRVKNYETTSAPVSKMPSEETESKNEEINKIKMNISNIPFSILMGSESTTTSVPFSKLTSSESTTTSAPFSKLMGYELKTNAPESVSEMTPEEKEALRLHYLSQESNNKMESTTTAMIQKPSSTEIIEFNLDFSSVNTSKKTEILGKINKKGMFSKIEVSGSAWDQDWGNYCSFYTIGIMRNGEWLISKGMSAPRPRSNISFIIESDKPIMLEDTDEIVILLDSPYTYCATYLENILVKLYITPPMTERFGNLTTTTSSKNVCKNNNVLYLIILVIIVIVIVLLITCKNK